MWCDHTWWDRCPKNPAFQRSWCSREHCALTEPLRRRMLRNWPMAMEPDERKQGGSWTAGHRRWNSEKAKYWFHNINSSSMQFFVFFLIGVRFHKSLGPLQCHTKIAQWRFFSLFNHGAWVHLVTLRKKEIKLRNLPTQWTIKIFYNAYSFLWNVHVELLSIRQCSWAKLYINLDVFCVLQLPKWWFWTLWQMESSAWLFKESFVCLSNLCTMHTCNLKWFTNIHVLTLPQRISDKLEAVVVHDH